MLHNLVYLTEHVYCSIFPSICAFIGYLPTIFPTCKWLDPSGEATQQSAPTSGLILLEPCSACTSTLEPQSTGLALRWQNTLFKILKDFISQLPWRPGSTVPVALYSLVPLLALARNEDKESPQYGVTQQPLVDCQVAQRTLVQTPSLLASGFLLDLLHHRDCHWKRRRGKKKPWRRGQDGLV